MGNKPTHPPHTSQTKPDSPRSQAGQSKKHQEVQPKVQRTKSKYKLMKLRHPGKDIKLGKDQSYTKPQPERKTREGTQMDLK